MSRECSSSSVQMSKIHRKLNYSFKSNTLSVNLTSILLEELPLMEQLPLVPGGFQRNETVIVRLSFQ